MSDGRKNNGGKRKGAGRPTKVDEAHVNQIFLTALKRLHNKDNDDEAKIEFVKDLYESQRGQIFIAEHLFGKPKEQVHNTHEFNQTLESIKDIYSAKNTDT